MQDPRSSSTLELVVNEQQLQNMSQVDLSSPDNSHQRQNSQTHQNEGGFSFQQLKKWPSRFRESYTARIEEAKAKSNTKTELVFEILQEFSGILIWIMCFICTTTLPVFLFFIGLANLDNCPSKPPLPYLIFATGFVMTASNLFNLALSLDLPILTNHQILSIETKNTISSIINIILNCVVAFLYILSAYMVYTVDGKNKQLQQVDLVNKEPLNDPVREQLECSSLLYYFSFWYITLTLGLFAILTAIAILFCIYNHYRIAIIRGSTPRSQTTTNINNTLNINPEPYATNRV